MALDSLTPGNKLTLDEQVKQLRAKRDARKAKQESKAQEHSEKKPPHSSNEEKKVGRTGQVSREKPAPNG